MDTQREGKSEGYCPGREPSNSSKRNTHPRICSRESPFKKYILQFICLPGCQMGKGQNRVTLQNGCCPFGFPIKPSSNSGTLKNTQTDITILASKKQQRGTLTHNHKHTNAGTQLAVFPLSAHKPPIKTRALPKPRRRATARREARGSRRASGAQGAGLYRGGRPRRAAHRGHRGGPARLQRRDLQRARRAGVVSFPRKGWIGLRSESVRWLYTHLHSIRTRGAKAFWQLPPNCGLERFPINLYKN